MSPPLGSGEISAPAAEHHPYVPDDAQIPEFTFGPVLAGALLGIVFGASSLYLVLKVGLTVSASIPVAVLSITLFRVLSKVFGLRSATILEINIVQTAGSAGESIAFGVGATMPALMILGFEMDVSRVMVVAVLGGLLGILMMIPLRRAYIVRQHRTLKYPEGTACADVLIVGEQGGATAKTVFAGFGVALIYQFLWGGMNLWKEAPSRALSWFKGAVPSIEVNPALLGVGYIIGARISCVMAGGGVLAWMVLAPAIRFFGDPMNPLHPAEKVIRDMTQREIRDNYMLYIGAGAVAAGGVFSLMQALPLIVGSIWSNVKDLRSARRRGAAAVPSPSLRRTDQDMPLWLVGAGGIALVAAIWATTPLHAYVFDWIPDLQMNALGALLIVLFGFLFVTVSSRLTGEIGSSSNPISGMTVATLLLTCLIFYALSRITEGDRLANESDIPRYTIVPAGTRLKLPDDTNAVVQKQTPLGDVAKDLLGKAGEASRLLELNDKKLSLPKRLPDGTTLKVPQRNWPAIAIFSALSILLLCVGVRNGRKPNAATKTAGG